MTAMDFNVTREQWIDRFAMRLSNLKVGSDPAQFVELARTPWPLRGQIAPESAADSEFTSHAAEPFEHTQRFERTERIPVERVQTAEEYVRDNDEWVARCVARVLQLDPIIKDDEARRSVVDLAELERWRLMKPETAAEQIYPPIKPRRA